MKKYISKILIFTILVISLFANTCVYADDNSSGNNYWSDPDNIISTIGIENVEATTDWSINQEDYDLLSGNLGNMQWDLLTGKDVNMSIYINGTLVSGNDLYSFITNQNGLINDQSVSALISLADEQSSMEEYKKYLAENGYPDLSDPSMDLDLDSYIGNPDKVKDITNKLYADSLLGKTNSITQTKLIENLNQQLSGNLDFHNFGTNNKANKQISINDILRLNTTSNGSVSFNKVGNQYSFNVNTDTQFTPDSDIKDFIQGNKIDSGTRLFGEVQSSANGLNGLNNLKALYQIYGADTIKYTSINYGSFLFQYLSNKGLNPSYNNFGQLVTSNIVPIKEKLINSYNNVISNVNSINTDNKRYGITITKVGEGEFTSNIGTGNEAVKNGDITITDIPTVFKSYVGDMINFSKIINPGLNNVANYNSNVNSKIAQAEAYNSAYDSYVNYRDFVYPSLCESYSSAMSAWSANKSPKKGSPPSPPSPPVAPTPPSMSVNDTIVYSYLEIPNFLNDKAEIPSVTPAGHNKLYLVFENNTANAGQSTGHSYSLKGTGVSGTLYEKKYTGCKFVGFSNTGSTPILTADYVSKTYASDVVYSIICAGGTGEGGWNTNTGISIIDDFTKLRMEYYKATGLDVLYHDFKKYLSIPNFSEFASTNFVIARVKDYYTNAYLYELVPVDYLYDNHQLGFNWTIQNMISGKDFSFSVNKPSNFWVSKFKTVGSYVSNNPVEKNGNEFFVDDYNGGNPAVNSKIIDDMAGGSSHPVFSAKKNNVDFLKNYTQYMYKTGDLSNMEAEIYMSDTGNYKITAQEWNKVFVSLKLLSNNDTFTKSLLGNKQIVSKESTENSRVDQNVTSYNARSSTPAQSWNQVIPKGLNRISIPDNTIKVDSGGAIGN